MIFNLGFQAYIRAELKASSKNNSYNFQYVSPQIMRILILHINLFNETVGFSTVMILYLSMGVWWQ